LLLRAVARAARERKIPLKLLLIGFFSEEHKRSFIEGLGADERQVFNARLGYTFTPYIDALYAASDLHVLNSQGSHGRGETFGRATVHAMTFHLPALGTNAGGTPEIIEDGIQGFVYPVGEAGQEVLIDRLEALAKDSNLRKKMGEAAEDRARRHFSKGLYLRQINDILESMNGHIERYESLPSAKHF
jgi:glycosyltransferase involved in cell wall biosynthesis